MFAASTTVAPRSWEGLRRRGGKAYLPSGGEPIGMEEIHITECPACGHPMSSHHGHHCKDCERDGVECAALEGGVESPGG